MDDTNIRLEIDNYLSHLTKINGLSENTIIAYKEDLDKLSSYLVNNNTDIYSLTSDDASLFLLSLMDQGLSPKSINRALATYRGFYKLAYRDKKVSYNPFSNISNSHITRKLPNVLTKDEVNRVVNNYSDKDDFDDIRNTAILKLFYSTGARRAEIRSINMRDIDFKNSQILITGKGNKERFIFITVDAEKALREYIKLRDEIAPENEDALFITSKGKRVSLDQLNKLFNKLKVELNLQKNITPHTMRHTFATHLMEDGMDIKTLQELLGHSSISTTGIYTHLSLKDLKNTYKKTHPHA